MKYIDFDNDWDWEEKEYDDEWNIEKLSFFSILAGSSTITSTKRYNSFMINNNFHKRDLVYRVILSMIERIGNGYMLSYNDIKWLNGVKNILLYIHKNKKSEYFLPIRYNYRSYINDFQFEKLFNFYFNRFGLE